MNGESYIQARREWDERYGDLVLGKRNWQLAFAGLMLLSAVLAVGIVWMGARTKVIPYVVEVDKLGYAITLPTALTPSNTPNHRPIATKSTGPKPRVTWAVHRLVRLIGRPSSKLSSRLRIPPTRSSPIRSDST